MEKSFLKKRNRIAVSHKKTGERIMNILWSVFRAFLLIGLSYIVLYPIIFMASTAI